MLTIIIISLILLFIIWYFNFGKDVLLYKDGWLTKAAFHDKAVHFVVGYALYLTVPNFIYITACAILYEYVTHYPRKNEGLVQLTLTQALSTAWRDIVATLIGAIVAYYVILSRAI